MTQKIVLLLAALSSGCVGAFMLDASGARGSGRLPPVVRLAELSPHEIAAGCTLTQWQGSPVLWVVLDTDGHPTGVNAGGLMEIVCPSPGTTARFCVEGAPVKAGVYSKDGLLVGCKR